jgi:hypothetical protein
MTVTYRRKSEVAARYGVSTKTIERWREDPDLKFPRGIDINGREYFPENELNDFDARRAVRGQTAA